MPAAWRCGQVAAEFADVGQPPDLGAGRAFRHVIAAADDAPPRADVRWTHPLRARQIDPGRAQGGRNDAVARPSRAVGTDPHQRANPDRPVVDCAVDMVEEDIHLALRVGHLPDSQLVARKLADLRMIVCASPAYLERRGVPQIPADLSRHDCLVFSDAPDIAEWRFKEGVMAERRIRVSGRLWVNSLDAVVSAAKEGAGIIRVPSWQI